MEGHEGHNSRYREYVDKAVRSHLAKLQNLGMRGWTASSGSFVSLSEDEALECSVAAFERFMKAIDKRNQIVMELIIDNEPDSANTFRMLRRMFKCSAYDLFRKGGREVAEADLIGRSDSDDSGAAANMFEKHVNDYLQLTSGLTQNELFEVKSDLGKIVDRAIEIGRLNKTRQFILLAHLQGREDADIADELDLETIQVQKHLYKIRDALKAAHQELKKVI